MEQETKKKILTGIIIAAAVLLFAAFVFFLAFIGRFNRYNDGLYGFSVDYPRRWQKIVHPQPNGAVVFISPKTTALDVFQENVNISVEDVPSELASLKSFSDKIVLQMTKVFNNIKIEESKPYNLGSRKGYRLVFSALKPDYKVLTVWAIKSGEKAYILSYIAATKQYPQYLPLVEEMIKSFKVN